MDVWASSSSGLLDSWLRSAQGYGRLCTTSCDGWTTRRITRAPDCLITTVTERRIILSRAITPHRPSTGHHSTGHLHGHRHSHHSTPATPTDHPIARPGLPSASAAANNSNVVNAIVIRCHLLAAIASRGRGCICTPTPTSASHHPSSPRPHVGASSSNTIDPCAHTVYKLSFHPLPPLLFR